ncbi:DUF1858 domain-containing protein [Bacteroidetes/Chlorobi group bacterium Naka2016]|jgi:hypothetical protein|nr:MAG: DUF1858 domain-containing protein [Bacteroidetes/Chlorobi group bacterium Naka2016]
MITKETTIEDLVTILPDSVSYMMEKGIRLLICGEPIWGTVEEVVLAKGFTNSQLEEIISDLNKMLLSKNETMAQ